MQRSTMGQTLGVILSGREILSGPSPFDGLPEDCISNIISFTSPRDACVAASVSKTFETAVKSDRVWEKFLPTDYSSLFPQSLDFSSKKKLYFSLCDHFLIEDGKKSFWLEKASGKRCMMLSSKELWMAWGNSPEYWQWISIPEARFEVVAELLDVCWFEVYGYMNTRILSPRTRYAAYIVFKTKDQCPGLGSLPVEVGIGLKGQEYAKRFIYFVGPTDRRRVEERKDVMKPQQREDGWMEAELGEFFNEESCDEMEVSVVEIKTLYWKRGLIIQGIEFRPAKSP